MRIAGPVGMVSLISATKAATADPIVLRDIGPCYVGGRTLTIAGEPVREVPLPGGQMQRVDHKQMYVQYVLPQNRHGASTSSISPDRGIKGNTHMMMMDKNNGAVASVIQDWLAARHSSSDRIGFASPQRKA